MDSDMHEYAKKYAHLRRVVCAAIRAPDGDILVGIRHFSPDMRLQIKARVDGIKFYHCKVKQGFVDQLGNFMSREEAYVVATKAGQIISSCDSGVKEKLLSENLY